MTMNDPIAAALSKIVNAEKIGNRNCNIRHISKLLKEIFGIMRDHHYLGEFKDIKDGRGDSLELELLGKINGCGAIKPRYPIKKEEVEKFEKRYLPAKDFGIMIISTQKGLMTHKEMKKNGLGGRLIAYCY